MGLKNSQYYAIMRDYERKQLKSHDMFNTANGFSTETAGRSTH